MRLVIFGLSVSSSWGNGHATIWRGLIGALERRGHDVVFFERDTPYYAAERDLRALPSGELVLYSSLADARSIAEMYVDEADAVMVTSYCPDALEAADLCLSSRAPIRVFYDLDTPVTLERLRAGRAVDSIGEAGLSGFDLVLSFTGGAALDDLRRLLGARRTAPLYGCVDPSVHRPAAKRAEFEGDLSYLGTFAADRQAALCELFLKPARDLPQRRFVIGGSLYPSDLSFPENVRRAAHVPPGLHPAFYCSSPLTLNVTRASMAAMGYCPSGRLFEAAACGVPIVSDEWEGLDDFFSIGREILVARSAEDMKSILAMSPGELAAIGRAARERALDEHTADSRASELLDILGSLPNRIAPATDHARAGALGGA